MPDELIKTVDLESIAARFETRATRLRRQSYLFLFLIVVMLFSGAMIFIFAAQITAKDLGLVDTLDQQLKNIQFGTEQRQQKIREAEQNIRNIEAKIKPEKEKIQIEQKDLRDESAYLSDEVTIEINKKVRPCTTTDIDLLRHDEIVAPLDLLTITKSEERSGEFYISVPKSTIYFSSKENAESCIQSFTSDIKRKVDRIQEISKKLPENVGAIRTLERSIKPELDQYREEIGKIQKELKVLFSLRENITSQIIQRDIRGNSDESTGEKTRSDWPTLIQTNTTRFGSLLIILFLVSILVSQYRYNIRLVGYYEARADAVRLKDGPVTVDEFERLVIALTPTFDFGKPPATPVEQVIELAKTLKPK
jgi:predicted  nucleic acid-binding Zn-ribbon protein